MWQCLLMFTILETESEQLLEYLYNNFLVKTMVNHCMLTYFMKLCLTKFKALYGKKWFYFTFWQVFNIWLHRRQLDSYICFCI